MNDNTFATKATLPAAQMLAEDEFPLFSGSLALLRRDLVLAWQCRGDMVTTLSFFAAVVLLFPLASGAERGLLRILAPSVMWIAALFAHVLAAQRSLADDARNGILEQWLLAPQPLALLVGSRILSQWIVTSLPLILLAPLLALPFDLSRDAIITLVVALALGTPALTAIGIAAAALTLHLRQGTALLALLAMPLEVPVLVFGAGAVEAITTGLSPSAHLSLLAAFSLLAVPGAALTGAVALRIAHA